MSTKIYNGYRIRTSRIETVMHLLKRVNEGFELDLKVLYAKRIASIAARALDLIALGDAKVFNASFPQAKEESTVRGVAVRVLDEQRIRADRSSYRDPLHDFSLSITIIPSKNCFLAVLFCEQKELSRSFTEAPTVEPFPYWDNTDAPAGTKPDEWRKRGLIWEAALKGADCVGHAGLSRDFFLYPPIIGSAEAAKHVRPRPARADELARYRVMNKHMLGKVNEKTPSHEVYSLVREAETWLKTPDGQGKLAAEAARLERILPEITAEHLKAPFTAPT